MFARTARLLLRPVWAEDSHTIHNAINDEAILRNLSNAPWPYTIQDAEFFVNIEHPSHAPNFMVVRRTKGTPELIGSCGLIDRDGVIEIGYWIARQHWGFGYASEAARAVLEIAHCLGHTSVHAAYFTDNPASGNVLRKLGFKNAGANRLQHSMGRNASVETKPMIIKDLSDIIANEQMGGGNINMLPPTDSDAYKSPTKSPIKSQAIHYNSPVITANILKNAA